MLWSQRELVKWWNDQRYYHVVPNVEIIFENVQPQPVPYPTPDEFQLLGQAAMRKAIEQAISWKSIEAEEWLKWLAELRR